MADGWVKIHRKILKSPIFKSDKGFKVWMWCILKAAHEKKEVVIGHQIVHLLPGQFVFGRLSAGEELGMKPTTVRRYVLLLELNGNVVIKSTNKYSVITVLNWDTYQSFGQQMDNKWTTNGHKQEGKEIKEVSSNRVKNNKQRLKIAKNTQDIHNDIHRLSERKRIQ